jgi:hypothetical protein
LNLQHQQLRRVNHRTQEHGGKDAAESGCKLCAMINRRIELLEKTEQLAKQQSRSENPSEEV